MMMMMMMMTMMMPLLVCILSLSYCFLSLAASSASSNGGFTGIGVNYGMVADNLPTPTQVAAILKNSYIDKVKIYNTEPAVLQAFSHTQIGMVVCVMNEEIPAISNNPNAALAWVKQRIAPYYPATSITYIAVGNEILTGKDEMLMNQLVPAMENIHKALVSLHMDEIKVSTPHSMAVLATSYPPSSSSFQPNLLPVMKPLLEFLSTTGSSFMANVYPYFAYKQDSMTISLDYALFRPNPGVKDPNSGLHYTNLFDAQVDAMNYAINAAGFNEVQVIVSETGWPSAGDSDEEGSGIENAKAYNTNLIKHVASSTGTPYKPGMAIETYIFALFNEDLKPGPDTERHFGLLYPDRSSVYDIGLFKFTTSTSNSGQTSMSCRPPMVKRKAPPAYMPPIFPAPAMPRVSHPESLSQEWCIADSQASPALLQESLDYACGHGADCSAIQAGESCYLPNTLVAHASFAFNSYYQKMGRKPWNCVFNNAAFVTTNNPSYGSCVYPTQ